MQCPTCGTHNPDGAPQCLRCGSLFTQTPGGFQQPPGDYIVPKAADGQPTVPADQQPTVPYGTAPGLVGQPHGVYPYPPGPPPGAYPYPPGPYGYQQYPVAPGLAQSIPNYLVWAILTTIFCCVPFGIVAIVYAAQVNSKLAMGDIAGAMDYSNKARTWSLASLGCGLLIIVPYILVIIASGGNINPSRY